MAAAQPLASAVETCRALREAVARARALGLEREARRLGVIAVAATDVPPPVRPAWVAKAVRDVVDGADARLGAAATELKLV